MGNENCFGSGLSRVACSALKDFSYSDVSIALETVKS